MDQLEKKLTLDNQELKKENTVITIWELSKIWNIFYFYSAYVVTGIQYNICSCTLQLV